MLHDAPLYFCWLGVLLERVGQTARILDVNYHAFLSAQSAGQGAHPIVEVSLWLSLLRACYGFEPFMKSHRGVVTAPAGMYFSQSQSIGSTVNLSSPVKTKRQPSSWSALARRRARSRVSRRTANPPQAC